MNVTHLVDNLEWAGGLETYVLNLIPELAKRGVNQSVVFNEKSDEVGVEGYCKLYKNNDSLGVESALKKEKTDIIHVHNIYNKELFDKVKNDYKIIFTTHNYKLVCPATNFFLKNTGEVCNISCSWKCFFTSMGYRCMPLRYPHVFNSYNFSKWALDNEENISHLVCPSKYAKERHKEAGFSDSLMSVVPYFCSLPTVQKPNTPKEKVVTFMGRIRSYKGWEEFLEIISYLPEDVKGRMIGDFNDEKRRKVEKLARELCVRDRLTLENWVDRSAIRDVFAETSVFVFSSIWPETLGIVGIEALSSGVPVVAFDVGGVDEWLIDQETGFMAEVKDCESAAEHISDVIYDESKMKEMGNNGIDLVDSKFSIEKHTSEIENIYSYVD